MTAVVRCDELRKSYGELRAVDGVSFEVREGEIFGMIGPNGAGKTTLMECVEGLRVRDSGTVEVLGLDPERHTREVRERTGLQLQSSALPSRIKVGEALELFASFYRRPADWRAVLARLGLTEKASSYVEKLSGGQRQRVFIALALINNPEVVFVDEITTGLDPQARLAVWDVIRDIRDQGSTVFMTTHFMEEAERLCDRVAIVDKGRIVALDTVPGLIGSLDARSRVSFALDGAATAPADRLRALPEVAGVEEAEGRVVVRGSGDRFAQQVMAVLAEADLTVRDFRSEQPSLEDVFLSLTGRRMREAA
ncbi:ABC transporter ATP-binding protein [Streptomyces sp. 6N223]|uniref:ABC transporter ATP-binding protein n=1 Tax=Streptomyces sp. 6N223 TaxID=3457412 RepID=UPI003FD5251B